MRRLLITLSFMAFIAGCVLVAPTPHAANADGRDFTLVNYSQATFVEVYVSPSGDDDWGDSILDPGYVLLPNRQVPVNFLKYDPTSCYYDVLVVGANGEQGELYNINLCVVDTVTFS